MMEEKNNKGPLYAIIVILCLLVIGLGGFIIYDKGLKNDKKDNKETETKKTYKAYAIGDKVTVKLNDSKEETFYVLKASKEDEEFVTLFAEKNIGTSAFQEDFKDGNEFEFELIQSKLNELNSDWKNDKEKRLITVDEIEATGLTEVQMEARCIDAVCPEEPYTYVKKDNFLRYESNGNYEFYWTMTKVDESDSSTGNTNRYVYMVDMSGGIEMHIVGYKPGSNENKKGEFFKYFGIRPVIVISKEYIK